MSGGGKTYRRKMKKSNVVVINEITQQIYTNLLVEVDQIEPPITVLQQTFYKPEGQAKFTLESQEDADRMLK